MKKLSFFLLALTIALTAFGQNDPISINLARTKQDTIQTLLTQFAAAQAYVPLSFKAANIQTISIANDTVKGRYLTVVTASRKDTIRLIRSKYTGGQVMNFICTNSGNDSTIVIPDHGTINGASTYWYKGTYKSASFYFDGTNYFILNNQ